MLQNSWVRIGLGALLSEVTVVVVLSGIIVGYRFLVAPGREAAEYRAFGERTGYRAAPTVGAIAVFFCAIWATRSLTSGYLVNGTLVGVASVVLTLGFFFSAKPEHRFMYGVAFALRILTGFLGGVVAQRMYGPGAIPGFR